MTVLESPTQGLLKDAPPPMQRWEVARDMLAELPSNARIAVVDADTMIRWDTPDFLQVSEGDIGAVHAGTRAWLERSVRAYAPYFPTVNLDWRACFNSGLVILGPRHKNVLDNLISFYRQNREELERIQAAEDVGVDQTLLNYFVHGSHPVRYLASTFNLMRCCEKAEELVLAAPPGQRESVEYLQEKLRLTPRLFDFINEGYVWHFTMSVKFRAAMMAETWRLVRCHYT